MSWTFEDLGSAIRISQNGESEDFDKSQVKTKWDDNNETLSLFWSGDSKDYIMGLNRIKVTSENFTSPAFADYNAFKSLNLFFLTESLNVAIPVSAFSVYATGDSLVTTYDDSGITVDYAALDPISGSLYVTIPIPNGYVESDKVISLKGKATHETNAATETFVLGLKAAVFDDTEGVSDVTLGTESTVTITLDAALKSVDFEGTVTYAGSILNGNHILLQIYNKGTGTAVDASGLKATLYLD